MLKDKKWQWRNTVQKMKFSIKDFFSKYDQIYFQQIWSHLLKEILIENFIFCVAKSVETLRKNLVSEAIASDGNRDHAMKAASFAKALIEKESTLKDLNMALEKLEEEFKLLK